MLKSTVARFFTYSYGVDQKSSDPAEDEEVGRGVSGGDSGEAGVESELD